MIEYIRNIEEYSKYWLSSFSKLTSESEWGKISLAESYLRKYWLSEEEYNAKWRSIQEDIFRGLYASLPDLVFKEKYKMMTLRGGCLFLKEDFEQLRECLLKIGETHLIIIENTFAGKLSEPSFRMKYPATISWDEITSGNFISSTIIEHPHKEFFVFGSDGKWGKYSASDYIWPLDIIGFSPEYGSIFRKHFKQSEEEREEIKGWLPPNYKEEIK